jgi:hypothetical protein
MNLLFASIILSTMAWSIGGDLYITWADSNSYGTYNVYRSHNGEPYSEIRTNFKGFKTTLLKTLVPMEKECIKIAPVVNGVVGPMSAPNCMLLMDAPQK